MRLITAHKILIGTAFALVLLVTVRSGRLFVRHHAPIDAVFVHGGIALAIILGRYFTSLRGR